MPEFVLKTVGRPRLTQRLRFQAFLLSGELGIDWDELLAVGGEGWLESCSTNPEWHASCDIYIYIWEPRDMQRAKI